MQKNLYSLMLSEEVVNAVDRLAHAMHTNRSNMVNQILAEYVSYVTPEKRIKEVFSLLESAMSAMDAFQIPAKPSAYVFQARSALAYKYNPSVQYNVEFYRRDSSSIGELRVSMRTQNSTLRLYLLQFFKLWSSLERNYCVGAESAVYDGKFIKKLETEHLPQDTVIDAQQIAGAISAYVRTFDDAMKAFFYQIDEPRVAAAKVEQIYCAYLRSTRLPL